MRFTLRTKNLLYRMHGIPRALILGTIFALSLQTASAGSLLTLLHKIQVDPMGPAGACDGVAFSPDGQIVAASDNQGNTRLYRVDSGEKIMEVHHAEWDEVRGEHRPSGETNAIEFQGCPGFCRG